MTTASTHLERPSGHAFISYVHEDSERVDQLVEALEDAGIKVWRDKDDIAPGADWKTEIRRAITDGALAFVACFSSSYEQREKTYQNEELIIAAEQIRLRPIGHTWYIPVRFEECNTPRYDIGAGRDLTSIQHLDLFVTDWERSIRRLVAVIVKTLSTSPGSPSGGQAHLQASTQASPARQVRDIILDPTRRLQVEDIFDDAVEDLKAEFSDPERFPLQMPSAVNTATQIRHIADRAHAYADASTPLIELLVAGCSSGATQYHSAWARCIQSLAGDLTEMRGGSTGLINLRTLPLILLTYAASLAGFARGDFGVMRAVVVDARYTNSHRERVPVIGTLHTFLPFDGFTRPGDLLAFEAANGRLDPDETEGHLNSKIRKYHTPVSDYVQTTIRPFFRRLIPDEPGFDEAFDSVEVYLGIIAQYEARRAKEREIYMHGAWYGSFVWRNRNSFGEKIEGRIGAEILQPGWPGYAAGLLGGSPTTAGPAVVEFVDAAERARAQIW